MALLSVIVPVYRVEEYLSECLDSILHQAPPDTELIAVDDFSDDGCAAVLARYAAADPRVTVVTLPRNGGLGAARNAGLARAAGEYVWFVDSDDWLPDGAVSAVVSRLERTRPDLLITAFDRVYGSGRVRHESVTAGRRPAPDVFTLGDWPELISVLHIAGNKVIRRRFLGETGLRFFPGWYEDVSFSFPLMIAANRITLLDRGCYQYRQRENGAITQTVSGRHFEVFAQWDRVFEFLAAHPVAAELHVRVFQRMIWHLLQVLGHPRRISPTQRREFFRRMTRQYRTHLPPTGHPVPAGAAGVKYRLVGLGAYRLFELLRAVRGLRVRRTAPGPAAAPVDPSGDPSVDSPVEPSGGLPTDGRVPRPAPDPLQAGRSTTRS